MNLMHYLLEANLYLVAFYLLYVLLLRSETLYQLNRSYLLITSLIAFILPVTQLGILKPKPIEAAPIVNMAAFVSISAPSVSVLPESTPQIMAIPPQAVTSRLPELTFVDYALIAYCIVTLTLFILLIVKVVKLVRLSKKGVSHKQNGFIMIEIPGSNVAFSFFKYLFVNPELLSSTTILHHEEVHIRQKHSWDVIYIELIKIVNWFNPAVYLIQKSLKEVHEFIADHEVAQAENGAADYADFLISNAYGLWPNQLTNSFFNKNLLKRRIIMLYQQPSGKAARLKYLITLPLLAGLLCLSTMAFTTKNYGWIDLDPARNVKKLAALADKAITKTKGVISSKDNLLAGIDNSVAGRIPADPTILDPSNKADEQPSFPGGEDAFHQFLKANIDHTKTGTDGAVEDNVMMFFTVAKSGSLYDINVHFPGGPEYADQTYDELKRVIKLSPKWIPATHNGEAIDAKHFIIFNSQKNISVGRSEYIKGYKKFGLLDNAAQEAIMANAPVNINTSGKASITPEDTVYNKVDKLPLFPGGYAAFGDYLRNNIRYPSADKEAKIQGRVFLQFIVEKDGSLSSLKVLRTPSETLAAEAMRVMAASPKWAPGMNNGVVVRTQFTLPVNFALDKDVSTGTPNGTHLKTVDVTLAPPAPGSNGSQQLYTAVEVQPIFPGGEAEFAKFLRQNIRYPKEAKEAGVTGRVFLQFIIESDGSLTDMKILRDPGKGLGDEALRVLKMSPKWNPGMQGGKAVRVQFVVPVNFSLADYTNTSTVLYKQLSNMVRYPKVARDNDIMGRMFVSFTVGADKQIQDIAILRSIDQSLDDELVRVLQKCKADDLKTGAIYVLPVYFNINYQGTKPAENPDNRHPGKTTLLNGKEHIGLSEVVINTYK